jgi:hypothetical protein
LEVLNSIPGEEREKERENWKMRWKGLFRVVHFFSGEVRIFRHFFVLSLILSKLIIVKGDAKETYIAESLRGILLKKLEILIIILLVFVSPKLHNLQNFSKSSMDISPISPLNCNSYDILMKLPPTIHATKTSRSIQNLQNSS